MIPSIILNSWLMIISQLLFISAEPVQQYTPKQSLVPTAQESVGAIGGLALLCLKTEPDGVALLHDTITKTSDDDEVLIIFKVDSFWIQKASEMFEIGQLISKDNRMKCSDYWPSYPKQVDNVASFYGLDKDNYLYNNVLVFSKQLLLRYQVEFIPPAISNLSTSERSIRVTLASTHTTAYWREFSSARDYYFLHIIRSSNVMIALSKRGTYAYWLNRANLDNPVGYETSFYPKKIPVNLYSIKSYYLLKSNQYITFSSSGELCLEEKCKMLHYKVNCDPQLVAFSVSPSIWLWRDTDFTIRLAMVTLSSIMVVNFVLAMCFIFNQLKHIMDLT